MKILQVDGKPFDFNSPEVTARDILRASTLSMGGKIRGVLVCQKLSPNALISFAADVANAAELAGRVGPEESAQFAHAAIDLCQLAYQAVDKYARKDLGKACFYASQAVMLFILIFCTTDKRPQIVADKEGYTLLFCLLEHVLDVEDDIENEKQASIEQGAAPKEECQHEKS